MTKLSKIKWFYFRWLSMDHPKEEIYRIKQFFQTFLWDKIRTVNPYLNSFIWNFNSKKYYSKKYLSDYFFNSDFDYNKFNVYELSIPNILNVDDWRKDYKYSKTSDIIHISKIYAQDFDKFGDIRYVYSLSRLHHFPFLSLKAIADNDYILISKLLDQIVDWNSQNPYLNSINWKSGIEVGIRAINLLYARRVLSLMEDDDSVKICSIIDDLMEYHFYFLIKHLSLFSSANNHLLFELLGIFFISSHYQFNDSKVWQDKSYGMLNSELLIQSFEDGFSKEQASHYHAEVMNIFSMVFSYAKMSGLSIPNLSLARLNSMNKALSLLRRGNKKHLIPIGDNDEGQILFPYFYPNFNLYDSLNFDINLINSNSNSIAGSDLRNYLIWGSFIQSNNEILPNSLNKINFFKDSGYLFINDSNISSLFDFGSLGFGHLAAHGHSDVLQFVLYVDDQAFFIDPGTFQYHERFSKLRNYFRGSSAHNTVSISGYDQGKSGGRMIWNVKPNVKLINFYENEQSVNCTASHDGFLKQGLGLIHTRSFSYYFNDHTFIIEDLLKSKINVDCNLFFHINPEIEIILGGSFFKLVGINSTLIMENELFHKAELIKGDSNIPLGWSSKKFDSIEECTVIKFPINFENDCKVATKIKIIKNSND